MKYSFFTADFFLQISMSNGGAGTKFLGTNGLKTFRKFLRSTKKNSDNSKRSFSNWNKKLISVIFCEIVTESRFIFQILVTLHFHILVFGAPLIFLFDGFQFLRVPLFRDVEEGANFLNRLAFDHVSDGTSWQPEKSRNAEIVRGWDLKSKTKN